MPDYYCEECDLKLREGSIDWVKGVRCPDCGQLLQWWDEERFGHRRGGSSGVSADQAPPPPTPYVQDAHADQPLERVVSSAPSSYELQELFREVSSTVEASHESPTTLTADPLILRQVLVANQSLHAEIASLRREVQELRERPTAADFIVMRTNLMDEIATLRYEKEEMEERVRILKQENESLECRIAEGLPLRMLPWAQLEAMVSEAVLLGTGGFGTVYKANGEGGAPVAVKVLHVSSHQGMRQFECELQTLAFLRHPNVIRLIAAARGSTSQLALVYELAPKGDLQTRLSEPEFEWPDRLDVLHGISRGLEYLHAHAVVHRDVKPANVLLFVNNVAKLTDMGLARYCPDAPGTTHVATRIMGTPGYLAPEMLYGQVSMASDVFAFGVMLLQVMCQMSTPMIGDEHLPDLLSSDGSHRLPIPPDVPGETCGAVLLLSMGCTERLPRQRLRMTAVRAAMEQLAQTNDAKNRLCVVCMINDRGLRLPCGHRVLCCECVRAVCQCPVCRQAFDRRHCRDDENPITFVK